MTVTRFDGTSLPAGWTAHEPAANTHVVVENGHCALKTDAGANVDSLAGSVDVPEGPRISTPVSAAFDYAVAIGAAPNSANGQGIDILALDTTAGDGIRFSQYVSDIGGRDVLWYGRANVPESDSNISMDSTPSNLWGPRGWMRLTWDGVDTFTLRSSQTGKPGSWFTHATVTSAFVPTSFDIDAVAFQPDTQGREQRVAAVVDMAGRADDATTLPGDTSNTTLVTPSLAGPDLPAELTGTENAGGTFAVSSGVLTMSTDSNVADSYAWVESEETYPDDHGLLLRYRFPQPSIQNVFAAVIARASSATDLPASQVLADKFRPGTGWLSEINGDSSWGDIIRTLGAYPVATGENFDGAQEFYGFTMKDEALDGPVDGGTGNWIWVRTEAIDGYYRSRFWYDGDPEPTGWQYEFEGYMTEGNGIALALGHNDSTTGGGAGVASLEVADLSIYEITESSTDPVPAGSATYTTETALTGSGQAPAVVVPTGSGTLVSETSMAGDGAAPAETVPTGSGSIITTTVLSGEGVAPGPGPSTGLKTLVSVSQPNTLIALEETVANTSEPYETYIKAGDSPTKEWQANDDLSSASEVRIISRNGAGGPIIDRAVDSVNGDTVSVNFTEAETAEVGVFNVEVEATWSDGTKLTYPERGYCRLYIKADLG